MAPIPFIGRLQVHEYAALTASFVLLFLETIVRTITLLLPTPIIRFCYGVSRNAFNYLSSPYSRRARNKKRSISFPIAQASDFVELCELSGYTAEEHIVQTKDGYLLGLHRLAWRKGEEESRVNAGPGSVQKRVVYLHHGLLMNSEVWVCLTEHERCLPFVLVDQGFDVWLGNNRGNKYSKKSLHHAPTEVPFWNFSMDQFAFHDIPDSIDYILSTTHQPSLSYIGFSQGTAQAFATLSIHPTLNSKVDVFVALAPAMAPPGLVSGVVSSLVKSNPQVLFLAFGRRAMLGSATMWQALLYPAIFTWFIDKSLSFLFGWKTLNITPHQKLAAYPHLYSFTSVKSVVHWFQIIRNGTFSMYDDEVTSPLAVGNGSKYYKVAKFPTRNIKTPIVLVYGGSDSLVDIKLMLKELPKHTVAKGIQKYEHLDLLWASDVDKLVFPHVLEALRSYAVPERTKQAAVGWRTSLDGSNSSLPPRYSDDDLRHDGTRDTVQLAKELDGSSEDEDEETPERFALTPVPVSRPDGRRPVRPQSPIGAASATSGSQRTVTERNRRMQSPRLRAQQKKVGGHLLNDRPASPLASTFSHDSKRSTRPEGWWSESASASEKEGQENDRMHPKETRRAHDFQPAASFSTASPVSTHRRQGSKASDSDASHYGRSGIGVVGKTIPVTGSVTQEVRPPSATARSTARVKGEWLASSGSGSGVARTEGSRLVKMSQKP